MATRHNRPNGAVAREIEQLNRRLARKTLATAERISTKTDADEVPDRLPPLMPLKQWACRVCSDGTCPQCRDIARWNAKFEQRYGAEMRAYYAAKPIRFGISNPGGTDD